MAVRNKVLQGPVFVKPFSYQKIMYKSWNGTVEIEKKTQVSEAEREKRHRNILLALQKCPNIIK